MDENRPRAIELIRQWTAPIDTMGEWAPVHGYGDLDRLLPLRLDGTRPVPLPATVVMPDPTTLSIRIDLGEISILPEDWAIVVGRWQTAKTRISGTPVVGHGGAQGPGRMRVSVAMRLSLHGLQRSVPLDLLVALCRRRAVALLLDVYDLDEQGNRSPGWAAHAAAPDHAAVARLLELPWPNAIDPSVLGDIASRFTRAGLGVPFMPTDLGPDVAVLGDWWWGTQSSVGMASTPFDAYTLEPMMRRYLAGDIEPRWGLSHNGYGVNSYAITYECVTSRLAVFAQAHWGGVYMDPNLDEAGVRLLSVDLDLLHRLVGTLERPPGQALVVQYSSYQDGNAVSWLPRQESLSLDLHDPWMSRRERPPRWSGLCAAIDQVEPVLMSELSGP